MYCREDAWAVHPVCWEIPPVKFESELRSWTILGGDLPSLSLLLWQNDQHWLDLWGSLCMCKIGMGMFVYHGNLYTLKRTQSAKMVNIRAYITHADSRQLLQVLSIARHKCEGIQMKYRNLCNSARLASERQQACLDLWIWALEWAISMLSCNCLIIYWIWFSKFSLVGLTHLFLEADISLDVRF